MTEVPANKFLCVCGSVIKNVNSSITAHMKTKKHEKFIADKEKGGDVKPDPKEQKRIYNQTHREKKKVENRIKDMNDIREFDEVIDKIIDDMKYNATHQVLIEAMSKRILKIVKVKSGHNNIAEIKALIKKHKIVCDKIKAAIDDPDSDSEDEGDNEIVSQIIEPVIIAPKYEDKPVDLNHIFFPERYPKPEEVIPQEEDIIPSEFSMVVVNENIKSFMDVKPEEEFIIIPTGSNEIDEDVKTNCFSIDLFLMGENEMKCDNVKEFKPVNITHIDKWIKRLVRFIFKIMSNESKELCRDIREAYKYESRVIKFAIKDVKTLFMDFVKRIVNEEKYKAVIREKIPEEFNLISIENLFTVWYKNKLLDNDIILTILDSVDQNKYEDDGDDYCLRQIKQAEERKAAIYSLVDLIIQKILESEYYYKLTDIGEMDIVEEVFIKECKRLVDKSDKFNDADMQEELAHFARKVQTDEDLIETMAGLIVAEDITGVMLTSIIEKNSRGI